MEATRFTAASAQLFDELMLVLEKLEAVRGEMHFALREARLSFVAAQMVLSQRYATLSLQEIPARINPTLTVVSDCHGVCGQMKVASRAPEQFAEGNRSGLSSDAEGKLWEHDPLFWFSSAPPMELRETQKLFRIALGFCPRVAAAEMEVLAALRLYEDARTS